MTLQRLLFVSRPRFWIYTYGPFLIGYTAGVSSPIDFLTWEFLLWSIFFLLPANIVIYGINDIYDYETDKANPKKQQKEALVIEKEHRGIFVSSSVALCLGVLLVLYSATPHNIWPLLAGFAGFLILGYAYSAPPIRAKTKPFLDSVFNVLYVMPAVVGYALVAETFSSMPALLAGGLWCMAMHAYSAVPDIEADRKASLDTIATFLGKDRTLLFCFVCYTLSGLLGMQYFKESILVGGLYIALMIVSIMSNKKGVYTLYWMFPFINMLVGAGIWVIVVVKKVL